MHYLVPFRITNGSNSNRIGPEPLFSILKEHLVVDIKVFETFDEFQSLHFQDIKEYPKHHGRTDGWTDGWKDGRTDDVKTEYPHKHSLRGV